MADRSEWLSRLYEANADAVFGRCRRMLGNPEDAADASHEVFLRAISSLDADPNSRQARNWLITVAQNHCLDLIRRRRRMQAALTNLASEHPREQESEAEAMNRHLLQTVLSKLGERERLALWQSAVERRSLGEIAGALGLSYAAAGQLVHRARKRASAVAGSLGSAIGVAALRLFRRRSTGWSLGQAVAALAIIPLAGASIVVATAGASHLHFSLGAFGKSPAQSKAHAVPANAPAAGVSASGAASTAELAAGRQRLGKRLRSALDTTVGNTVQTVEQTIKGVVPSPGLATPPPAGTPVVPLPTPSLPPLPSPTGLPKASL